MNSQDFLNLSANVQIAFALALIVVFLAYIAFKLSEKK
jgi:hypothetical protein